MFRKYRCLWMGTSYTNTIQSIVDITPIHVVKTSRNEFEFFSGFSSPILNHDINPEHISLLVYEKISSDEIEQLAWANIPFLLSFGLESKNGLASLYGAINKNMPENLCRQFFGRKSLSVQTMANWTGEKPSAIKWQLEKYNQEKPKKSIIDSILEAE